jgi:DNA-binding NtrC family response regulator
MTNPKPPYPNGQRMYPNAGPHIQTPAGAAIGGGEGPAFEVALCRLAPSRVTVLLVGGSIRLKEVVARALHERSPRASQPFVVFECVQTDSEAVELELFGGPAYAPAAAARGAIQRTQSGTLYVARIDQLPLLLQPRFLRFLDQERQARVVAATDADLAAAVERGCFRLDLAERLSLVELTLHESLEAVYALGPEHG